MKLTRKLVLTAPLLLVLAGCGTTRINRILNEPARYQNKNVTVQGRVTSSIGALVAGAYQVDDGTGKIYVLTNGNPPTKGSEVKLSGRVMGGVTLGTRSFGTAIRERDRKVKY